MRNRIAPSRARLLRRGMTLIELTVVILVLLSLVVILFFGARAWKRGSDRAACVIRIRQVQVAVRSYANINNREAGEDVSPVNLEGALIGPDAYVHNTPVCPGGGGYTLGGNVIPVLGELYMTCSLATDERHVPEPYTAW